MSILEKYNCILCKYKREDRNTCQSHGKCNSLSNIYYGKVVEYFPFKQINEIKFNIAYKKHNKYCEKMDKKYGDYALEDDDYKFIWGIKSWDDLSGSECNMQTMNDIDITYNKHKKLYYLGIETAYIFEDKDSECKYLKNCLDAFKRFMDKNNFRTDEPFRLFMSNPCITMSAETIEELYTNFRIFVAGFCEIIRGA